MNGIQSINLDRSVGSEPFQQPMSLFFNDTVVPLKLSCVTRSDIKGAEWHNIVSV